MVYVYSTQGKRGVWINIKLGRRVVETQHMGGGLSFLNTAPREGGQYPAHGRTFGGLKLDIDRGYTTIYTGGGLSGLNTTQAGRIRMSQHYTRRKG